MKLTGVLRMMSDLVLGNSWDAVGQHDLILDACSGICLAAAGQMEEILRSIDKPVHLAEYVRNREIRSLFNPITGKADITIDLSSYISSGLLTLATPTEEEAEQSVEIVMQLAELSKRVKGRRAIPKRNTGEAISGAIARARNFVLVTDDRDALAILCSSPYFVSAIPTLLIVHQWSVITGASRPLVGDVLYKIQVHGRYVPRETNPFWPWCKSLGL